jgi:hypothetical protein
MGFDKYSPGNNGYYGVNPIVEALTGAMNNRGNANPDIGLIQSMLKAKNAKTVADASTKVAHQNLKGIVIQKMTDLIALNPEKADEIRNWFNAGDLTEGQEDPAKKFLPTDQSIKLNPLTVKKDPETVAKNEDDLELRYRIMINGIKKDMAVEGKMTKEEYYNVLTRSGNPLEVGDIAGMFDSKDKLTKEGVSILRNLSLSGKAKYKQRFKTDFDLGQVITGF